MKSFKSYLTESIKEHTMVVRFAFELEDGDMDRIENFLGKYDLRSISSVSTTPITKNPLFFDDTVTNTEVSKFEITTGYPMSADILRQQLADLLSLSLRHIAVHPEGWEPEMEEEVSEDEPALLDSEYEDESDDGKNYGRTFVDNFLASLSKRDSVTVENELSVKPQEDAAPEQMPTDEKSSPSVISGDEYE